jgi:hypothetical protein
MKIHLLKTTIVNGQRVTESVSQCGAKATSTSPITVKPFELFGSFIGSKIVCKHCSSHYQILSKTKR